MATLGVSVRVAEIDQCCCAIVRSKPSLLLLLLLLRSSSRGAVPFVAGAPRQKEDRCLGQQFFVAFIKQYIQTDGASKKIRKSARTNLLVESEPGLQKERKGTKSTIYDNNAAASVLLLLLCCFLSTTATAAAVIVRNDCC